MTLLISDLGVSFEFFNLCQPSQRKLSAHPPLAHAEPERDTDAITTGLISASMRIPLHVSNGTAYVWSVDDIATLRTTYRICGTLTGTLPSISQQNVFLGLPLILLPEEVVTLVDTDAAYIVDDSASYEKPTTDQLERWTESRRAIVAAELKERDAASRATVKIDTSDKAQKKRLEREARKAAAQQNQDQEDQPEASPSDITTALQTQTHTVHVPGSSSELPWHNAKLYNTVDEARKAGVWTYPNNVKERAECAVFRNLWEKGNYLGPGIRFGGNYLVYPGDPLRFHSHFVASVHPSKTSQIRPIDIVAFGRLGTATKKVHLLCGYDDETGEVSYFSIEWASFG